MRILMKLIRLAAIPIIMSGLSSRLALPADKASTDSVPPLSSPKSGAAGGMSLAEWREEKQAAQGAMDEPRVQERIAACEAFIRAHPDYPDLGLVLWTLVDASFETRSFDPAKLASLVERLADAKTLDRQLDPETLLDWYYFRYGLPLESAQRLLKKARAGLATQRAGLTKETDPQRRRERQERLQFREAEVDLAEGRVLVAKGD